MLNDLLDDFANAEAEVGVGRASLSSLSHFVPAIAAFQPLPSASTDRRLARFAATLISMVGVLKSQSVDDEEREIGRQESLILALQLLTQLWADRPEPQSSGAVWLTLANAMIERRSGEPEKNIEEALSAYDSAASIFAAGSPEWARVMIGRGYAELDRVESRSNERAYQCFKSALTATQSGSRDHGAALIGLGSALRDRGTGVVATNQEEAVAAYSAAVALFEDGSPERSTALIGLAGVLQDRQQGDLQDNQEAAISAYESALAALPKTGTQRGQALLGLAQVLQSRLAGDRRVNQERAWRALREARTAFVEGSHEWARTQGAIGHFLQDREAGDRHQNQEDAISAYHAALGVFVVGGADWIKAKIGLGNVYQERLSGEARFNERAALDAYADALEYAEEGSATWAKIQIGIANTRQNTAEGDAAENQEQALIAFQGALAVFDPASVEYARVKVSLGNLLQDRLTGDPRENYHAALACFEGAIGVFKTNSEDWANVLLGLGNVLSHGDLRGDGRNHRRAIAAFEAAAGVFDALSRDGVYLRDCIAHEYFQLGEFGAALDQYAALADALKGAALIGLTPEAQHDILSWSSSAARYALASGARAGDATRGLLTAITLRTTLLTAGLQLSAGAFAHASSPVRAEAAALQKEYRSLAAAVLRRDANDVETRDELRVQLRSGRSRLTTLYSEQVAEPILAPVTLGDLSAAIPSGGAFVMISSSADTGYLYCVCRDSDGAVRLRTAEAPQLTERAVDEHILNGWLRAHRVFVNSLSDALGMPTADERIARHDAAWFAADKAMRSLIDWCENTFTPPLRRLLADAATGAPIDRVVLCPLGLLQYAPLHVAANDLSVSYAPTPALCRPRAASARHGFMAAVLGPMVLDPSTGRLHDDPALTLADGRPLAQWEAESLRSIGGMHASILAGTEATFDRLLRSLQQPTNDYFDLIVSAHGRADQRYANRSCLMLTPDGAHDGMLTADEIAALPLGNVATVYTVACESGMISGALPEEARSLVTAFLEGGAAGVVSALWSVPVVSASVFLVETLKRVHEDGDAPLTALAHVALAARRGEIECPAGTAAIKATILRHDIKLGLAAPMDDSGQNSQITDRWLMSSPLTWAAWTYTGANENLA